MPEPGINDFNFAHPTTDRGKPERKSRARLQIPLGYADFRLEDGQALIDVLGPRFFEPGSGQRTEEGRGKRREGSYLLARTVRDDPRFKRLAEAGIPYRDGLPLPSALSPLYYRDPVGPADSSEPRRPSEEPAADMPVGPKAAQRFDTSPERPESPEKSSFRSLNQDSSFPDKWAEKGWGGPRGHYSVPTLNNGADRIANILADKPARFDIQDNPKADPSHPWYASTWAGDAAIASYGPIIEREARKQGVDTDLVKAIAYSENARGHYFGSAKAAEGLDMADSLLPMNINPSIWGGLGIDRTSASDYLTNICAGITLIKRIADRIDNPTPEKIASIWNYTGRELVNDFGAYVGRIYRETPWEK